MSTTLAVRLLFGPLGRDDSASSRPPVNGRNSEATHAHDHDLAERVRHGDPDAFRVIHAEHFDRVTRFVYKIVREWELAQDITQDVLARVWERRDSWTPAISIRAYLFGAARHRAFDVLKHRDVQARHAANTLAESSEESLSADAELEQSSTLAVVRAAIAELPERRRLALELRYEHGLSHAEVGEALGITAKASKELIARTLDALRARLRDA